MRARLSIALAVVCLGLATPAAFAGTAVGKVYDPYFMYDGTVIVYVNGTHNSPPACATQVGRFIVDATTPAGKVLLSGLLTAYTTGKTVSVVGAGTCLGQSSETVLYFLVDD